MFSIGVPTDMADKVFFSFAKVRRRRGGKDRQHWVRTKKEKVGPKPGLKKSEVHIPFAQDRSIGVCVMRHENENMKINIMICAP